MVTEANRESRRKYMRTPKGKEARRRALLKVRERRTMLLGRLKAAPCTDCGRSFPPECMDFDHVPERGPKLFSLAGSHCRKIEDIVEELAKCDLVCACCHRTRTKNRHQSVLY